MAAAIPFVVKAFAAVKAAAATIGAVKIAGVTVATLGKVAMYAAMGASLLMKPPGLPSASHEISVQPAGPTAALPILFGQTRTGGLMVFREAVADVIHNSDKANNLVFQNVISVGPIGSIDQYKIGENLIVFDRNPLNVLAKCVGVQGFNSKSRVFKDGVHAVYTRGDINDTRTVRSLTGENLSMVGSQHGMAGLATVTGVYKLDGSKNLRFPMGPPDWPTVLAAGLNCYDPRKDSTNGVGSGSHRINNPSTWQFSENPYIVALAYLIGGKGATGHKSWGVGLTLDDIDLPSFIHGANVADANRWKLGGTVTTDDAKETVLANLLVAGAGQLIPSSKISVFVNEPKVSTFTITEKMLVGGQTIRATRSMNNRTNRLVVKYREPNQDYAIIAGPAIVDEAGVETDGGLRSSETTFALIQNATQAVQIGSYELVNSREYEVDLTTNMEAFSVEIGDAVNVEFAIGAIEGQQFIVKNKTYDHTSQTIEFTLVSETQGKHDFALGRTASPPAPPALKSLQSLNPSAPSAEKWAVTANAIKTTDIEAVEAVEEDIANGIEAVDAVDAVIGETRPAFVIEGSHGEAVKSTLIEVRLFDENRADRPTNPNVEIDHSDPSTFEAAEDQDWITVNEFDGSLQRLVVDQVAAKTTYDVAISYRTNANVVSPRLIWSELKSGGTSFDWNDDVIINLPPVLSDLADGGKIKAEFIDLQNEANASLQDAFDDLANAIVEADDRLTRANSDLSNAVSSSEIRLTQANQDLANTVSDAWDIIGRSDAVGLRKAVVDLQETGPDGQLVGRVEVLEANEANANAAILNLQSAQVELEHGLATKATTTQLNNLSGRVTSAENTIGGHATRLTNVEVAAAGKASVSDHNNLKAEVETARNGKASLSAELTSVRQASADGLAGKTNISDHNALVGRVTSAENTIGGHATRLTNVEVAAAGKVNISDFNNLTATVSSKAKVWRQDTDPVGASVGDYFIKTSDNNRPFVLVAGQGWVDVSDIRVTNLNASVSTLNNAVADLDGRKANASALTTVSNNLSSLTSTVDGHASRLTQVESSNANKVNISDFNNLTATVNTKTSFKVWRQSTEPVGANVGDILIHTGFDNRMFVLTAGQGWVEYSDLRVTNLNASVSTLNNAVADLDGRKANASALTTVSNNLSSLTSTVDGHASRLTQVESSNASKVNVSDFNSLVANVNTKTSFKVWRQATDPVGANVGDLLFKTSDNNRLFILTPNNGWIEYSDSRILSIQSSVSTLNKAIADLDAGKAESSTVTSLQSTVNGYSASISAVQSTVADVEGRVNAQVGWVLNANGKLAGIKANASAAQSNIDLMADAIRISNGSTSAQPFVFENNTLTAPNLRLTGSININDRFIVDANGTMTMKSAASGPRMEMNNQSIRLFNAANLEVIFIGIR